MNTLKLITIIIFALGFTKCSQENSAFEEDVYLESNEAYYDNSDADVVEESMPKGEASYEKDLSPSSDQGPISVTGTFTDKNNQTISYSKNHTSIVASAGLDNPYIDKKFIKTSHMEFKVEDVYNSTVNIENAIIANKGFLINSNLFTDIYRSETFVKDDEWNVEIQEYVTQNNITLRVPSENLHAILLQIAEEIEFLDYRNITVDDVTLKLLAEELEQKRNAKSSSNLQKLIQNGGKLDDKIDAEQLAFQRLMQQDQAMIQELTIEDQVQFSTITISIYQDSQIHIEEVANLEVYKEKYEKPYSSELKEGLLFGITLLKAALKLIVILWPLWMLAFIGYVVYRKKFK